MFADAKKMTNIVIDSWNPIFYQIITEQGQYKHYKMSLQKHQMIKVNDVNKN